MPCCIITGDESMVIPYQVQHKFPKITMTKAANEISEEDFLFKIRINCGTPDNNIMAAMPNMKISKEMNIPHCQ